MVSLFPVDYDPFTQPDPRKLGPGQPNAIQRATDWLLQFAGINEVNQAATVARAAQRQDYVNALLHVGALGMSVAPMALGVRGTGGPVRNALGAAQRAENPLLGQGERLKNTLIPSEGKVSDMKYPLADRIKEGWYGNGNFEQEGAQMVWMTPDQYLSRVRPLQIDDVSRENIDLLKAHMQDGKTLDPLAIYSSGKEDGRHRAYAAKELGIDQVPVLVYPQPIKAYHGSPHDFERFDMSRIGTGEGAQAYGHGLYFAENEGVARSYRDLLSNSGWKGRIAYLDNVPIYDGSLGYTSEGKIADKKIKAALSTVVSEDGIDNAINYFRNPLFELPKEIQIENNEALKWLLSNRERIGYKSQESGRMYEVNINAAPDSFLLWDKPLSEQPEKVRQALNNTWGLPSVESQLTMTGADVYRAFETNPELGLPALRNAGISGIKYLDQGSRPVDNSALIRQLEQEIQQQKAALPNDNYGLVQRAIDGKLASIERLKAEQIAANPTHNYVVFDDKLIDIIKKYGIAPLIVGGAMTLSDNPASAQHLVPVDHDPFAR